MSERRHKHGLQLTVNGAKTNVELDGLTLALVPDGVALRAYAVECIEALGKEMLPGTELPAAEALVALAERYQCSYAQVVKTAIARRKA